MAAARLFDIDVDATWFALTTPAPAASAMEITSSATATTPVLRCRHHDLGLYLKEILRTPTRFRPET
jgi:hypothetical protein